MVFRVLGSNVVVRNTYIMKSLKKFFEPCNTDEYTITTNVGVFFVWVFFYSKEYKDCRNEINYICLDICVFGCTSYQLDIHQYHLYNVMVKLTFL